MSQNDYLLTAEGHDMMEKKLYATVKKAPKVKPAQTTGNNANSVNVPFSTTTGTHFNDKKIGRKPELEGQKNLAAVPHMATLIRMKVGILFSLLALGKSTGYTMVDNKVALNVDESNPHKLPLDILDLGQEAVDKINNPDFGTTNMVESLFCAEHKLTGDVIVSYADIIYEPSVLRGLLNKNGDVVVTVDSCWKVYWKARYGNSNPSCRA